MLCAFVRRRRMHGNQNDSHVVDSELNLQRRRRFPMDHIKSNIAIFSQHKVDQATQCSVWRLGYTKLAGSRSVFVESSAR